MKYPLPAEIEYLDLSEESAPGFAYVMPSERPPVDEKLSAEIDYILNLCATPDEIDISTL